jgi:hypothetical protein
MITILLYKENRTEKSAVNIIPENEFVFLTNKKK